ncbi:hypothetical protein DSO57_1012572 [Entomophthora muscae]|uniref:Uncharacterized protein n=1 Tax=Entomophthora muscae TaxID=34485 RepID=A0ACC2UFF6_9FUNG|nr:hypothetical protein DSO57_1012572 [Entomophthora muscae]
MIFSALFLSFGIIGTQAQGSGKLEGEGKITTHHYEDQAGVLDTSQVMCGIKGSDMDLTRITAVAGLSSAKCRTCLKISTSSKTVYAMAVDSGGVGLDLNKSQFKELSGDITGLVQVKWEEADASHCAGVIKSGGSSNEPSYGNTQQETPQTPSKSPENIQEPNTPNQSQNKQPSDGQNTSHINQQYPQAQDGQNTSQLDQNTQGKTSQPAQSPQQSDGQYSQAGQSAQGQTTQPAQSPQQSDGQYSQADQSAQGQTPQPAQSPQQADGQYPQGGQNIQQYAFYQ